MVGNVHADGAELRIARAGGEPLAHLPLDHHEHPGDAGFLVEGPQHDGDGHVVGQVRHHGPGHRLRPENGVPGLLQHVGDDHPNGVPVGANHGLERRDERAIDLHRDDPSAGSSEGHGERAEPGAHLEDAIARADAGQLGDPSTQGRFDQEVLPE